MQELSFSQQERPAFGDKPPEPTKQMLFGNLTLSDIHGLTNLTTGHLHKLNQDLPTLLLDDNFTNHNHFDHHIVSAGETLSQIAADHLSTSNNQEIYNYVNQIGQLNHIDQLDQIASGDYLVFPDLNIATEGSIFHQVPPKPLAAFGPVTAASAGSGNNTGTAPAKVEESAVSEFFSGCANVVSELASGCVEEITERPLEFAVAVAEGIAVGVAVVALAPEAAVVLGAMGIVTTGAEIIGTIGTVGAAMGATTTGYELLSNGGDWFDAALVVAHPEDHNGAAVNAAMAELAEVSHFAVEQAQDFLGGLHPSHIAPHSGSRGVESEEDNEEKDKQIEMSQDRPKPANS